MNEIRFVISVYRVEEFEKFVSKIQKNVPELQVLIGESYNKVYKRSVSDSEESIVVKEFHKVCDCQVLLPEQHDWILLATYRKGLSFVTDYTKKLEFKNPNHGSEYRKCDLCGHECQNSYVIFNTKTGEELQVGCSCLKKFNIEYVDWISQFVMKVEDVKLSSSSEEIPFWNKKNPDPWAFSAIETIDLIKAAKAYYNNHKEWIRGYYENGFYNRSESSVEIQSNYSKANFDGSDEYVKSVMDFAKTLKGDSDFVVGMIELANSYYCTPSDAPKAYFMVKNYEEYLEKQRLNLQPLSKGMLVKVEGEVVSTETLIDFMFGSTTRYVIKTNKGYKVERTGKIPVENREDKTMTSFYALVKYVSDKKIVLDRALKNPKKGFEIVEL